ncbi:MAG: L,D-transpeptidase family protein [Rhodobacteraceae bacterium]|jgi:murein L,D-transpeptidase YafK|nr:L,D-transpeptidase family protein [Paracoccaceae bacterium]
MRPLARVFAGLTLVLLIAAGLALWYRPALAPPLPEAPLTAPVDLILIEKSARRLSLIRDGKTLRSYSVALGFDPQGDKERQGDGRTPEGHFVIDRRNGTSAYRLSLGLDYPQKDDIARGRAGGYDPGGDIMIHGQPNALPEDVVLQSDWTAGCIAVSNAEIEEIWSVAPTGTPVEIRP